MGEVLVLAFIITDDAEQDISAEEHNERVVAEDWGDECWRVTGGETARLKGHDGDVERRTGTISDSND